MTLLMQAAWFIKFYQMFTLEQNFQTSSNLNIFFILGKNNIEH